MKSINRCSARQITRPGGLSVAALVVAGAIVALLAGCGGGGGGGGGSTNVANVALSGTLTENGTPIPNKVVTVEGSSPTDTTTTDVNGHYALTVPSNQTITLEVQESIPNCSVADEPTDFTQQVVVGNTATQTANIVIPTGTVPPPPFCTGS